MSEQIIIPITQTIIGLMVAYIAYQQYKVNNDKLRLDLYNKRFEIYNKLLDLYLKTPNISFINNKVSENDKKSFDEFVLLRRAFTKYFRESVFLFEKSSGIDLLLKDIMDEFDFLIFHKESCESYLENLTLDKKIEHNNRIMRTNTTIERYLLDLEQAMKPYLDFSAIARGRLG